MPGSYTPPVVAGSGVQSDGTVLRIVKVTQAAYDALTPVATTVYIIVG